MKNSLRFILALALGLALAGTTVNAADQGSSAPGTLEKFPTNPTAEQTAWLAKAKAAYPMATCVISEDKLESGDMGPPLDFIYHEEGKPDRLVRFCCKDCVGDFRKDPARYLGMIDAAAKKKSSQQ